MALATRYWATFRLKRDAAYDTRYRALMKAFVDVGSVFWEEPTSFIAFDSRYGIDDIAGHLKKALNTQTDLLVVTVSETTTSRYVGMPDDIPNFFHHFPLAKKV